jgi:hypothetical protein
MKVAECSEMIYRNLEINEIQDCLSTQSVERGHEDCIKDFISELITNQVSSHR